MDPDPYGPRPVWTQTRMDPDPYGPSGSVASATDSPWAPEKGFEAQRVTITIAPGESVRECESVLECVRE